MLSKKKKKKSQLDSWFFLFRLYNSIAGARSDAPDYYGAERDNIALNSYNNLQQNYDSVVSNHGSLENIVNDVSPNVLTGEDWISQTETQNIGIL